MIRRTDDNISGKVFVPGYARSSHRQLALNGGNLKRINYTVVSLKNLKLCTVVYVKTVRGILKRVPRYDIVRH